MKGVLIASPDLIKWLKLENGVKLPETDDLLEETTWQLISRMNCPASPELFCKVREIARKVLKEDGKI